MSAYERFLRGKAKMDDPSGLVDVPDLSDHLFAFQSDIVRWALRRGRAAIFADCGMGKTPMQLEWAYRVPGRVIIAAPLAVAGQTVREAEKFGIPGVKYLREDDGLAEIVVTNYEMLDRFDPDAFEGVVLDESSILKSYTGKFRNQLVDDWGRVRFRLAATATPAPNDFMELGNHSEFLGVLTRVEMLAQYFVHDGGETQKWRLKGHAEEPFWKWLCSWAVMIRKPSDLGYEDGDFVLPGLRMHEHRVTSKDTSEGMLFAMEAQTLIERRQARKASVDARVNRVAELVNDSADPWLVWCDLNSESEALCSAIDDAVEVRGSDEMEVKEARLRGFTEGKHRVLVTKPSIAGWGMNWQHCAHMAFTGLSDSYEQFYQAVRRCWRFGQTREVHCHVVTADTEGAVVANIRRKEESADQMAQMMVSHMSELSREVLADVSLEDRDYRPAVEMSMPDFLK